MYDITLCTCCSSNICVYDNTYLVFLQVVDSPNKGHRLWSWDIQAFEELEWLICTAEKEEKYACICVCVASCLGAIRTQWSHYGVNEDNGNDYSWCAYKEANISELD